MSIKTKKRIFIVAVFGLLLLTHASCNSQADDNQISDVTSALNGFANVLAKTPPAELQNLQCIEQIYAIAHPLDKDFQGYCEARSEWKFIDQATSKAYDYSVHVNPFNQPAENAVLVACPRSLISPNGKSIRVVLAYSLKIKMMDEDTFRRTILNQCETLRSY
jgi:hypothetical protein